MRFASLRCADTVVLNFIFASDPDQILLHAILALYCITKRLLPWSGTGIGSQFGFGLGDPVCKITAGRLGVVDLRSSGFLSICRRHNARLF